MKQKSIYSCQQCGYQSPKWLGRCPDCGAWHSLVQETVAPAAQQRGRSTPAVASQRLQDLPTQEESRLSCGIGELDRVLGGGLVPGSLCLIGGDPGIGKSTLMLQAFARLAGHGRALYVSSEESAQQVKLRGERLQVTAQELYLLADTCLENINAQVEELKPSFLAIDSIQTVYTGEVTSAPGSVSQVRECAGRLMLLAKQKQLPVFIIGHVTKEGSIAGPRVLEHLVDTVLYFEGDPGQPHRLLRTVKNRYGSTDEIGVFAMRDTGLEEVPNPSELFLAERPTDAPGSCVLASLEGTRPILVEVQALVSPAPFGTPRRTAMGFDPNRLSLLVAVLEKKLGLILQNQDIFLNVVGGIRLAEPAADLGVLAAVASSHANRPLPDQTVLFGEVGLTGEVRGVSRPQQRLQEAARLGFCQCLLPARNQDCPQRPATLRCRPLTRAEELLEELQLS